MKVKVISTTNERFKDIEGQEVEMSLSSGKMFSGSRMFLGKLMTSPVKKITVETLNSVYVVEVGEE